MREVGRGAIVHSVEKVEDVSTEEGSKSCYELTVRTPAALFHPRTSPPVSPPATLLARAAG